jgi:hypothetical protein
VADLLKHLADLAVAAFGEGDFVPGIVSIADAADSSRLSQHAAQLLVLVPAFVDHDARAKLVERLIAGLAADLDQVDLRHLVGGAGEQVGKLAVVGHQQQAFALIVEASDREDTRLAGKEPHHRRTPLGIAGRRDVPLGLVQHCVAQPMATLARFGQQLAIDADVVEPSIGLSSEFGDRLAVDLNAPFGDQLLGLAAGGDSSGGNDLLQPFFVANGHELCGASRLCFRLIRQRFGLGAKLRLGIGSHQSRLFRCSLLSRG